MSDAADLVPGSGEGDKTTPPDERPQADATRPALRASVTSLVTDWTFEPSKATLRTMFYRARARHLRRRPAPRSIVLTAPTAAPRWNCLFLYMPDGVPDLDQRRLVNRARRLRGKLLVVFATAAPPGSPPPGLEKADALIWKDLPGFDFSAYAIALHAVALHSPGATAYVQNDSVLGPLGAVDAMLDRAPWDLTGFIASRTIENHLSSYAFQLRGVTPDRMRALDPVLSTNWCYNGFDEVVRMQETRLARVAARTMSVGAFWYMPLARPHRPLVRTLADSFGLASRATVALDLRGDILLSAPIELVELGHPFIKRSFFGKFAGLEDTEMVRALLDSRGWR